MQAGKDSVSWKEPVPQAASSSPRGYGVSTRLQRHGFGHKEGSRSNPVFRPTNKLLRLEKKEFLLYVKYQ